MNKYLLHLSICSVLLLSRFLLPYTVYLFVPYTLILAIVFFFNNRQCISLTSILQAVKTYPIFSLLCISFVIGLFLSDKIPYYLLKEVFAMFMLVLLALLFYYIVDSKSKFSTFSLYFRWTLYLLVFITSFLAIIKFNLEFNNVYFDILRTNQDNYYPVGSTLIIDYNFYSLMNIVCFVFLFFDLIQLELTKKKRIFTQILMFLIYNNVFFSSSRRGWILLMFVTACLILYYFIVYFFKNRAVKFPSLYFGLLIGFYFTFFSFFRTSHNFQQSVLKTIHFNQEYFNFEINRISNRYLTIFFPNTSIQLTNPYLNGESTSTVQTSSQEGVKGSDTTKGDNNLVATQVAEEEEENTVGSVLSDTNNLSGNRMIRIKYAFDLFKNSSNYSKIFGSGFDYMTLFGRNFFTKNKLPFHYDYPHNPFLSSLLYGGIISLLISVLFAISNFYMSFRLFKYMPEYFIIHLFFFYFILFSFNSFFGVPEYILFSIILTRFYKLPTEESHVNKNSCL